MGGLRTCAVVIGVALGAVGSGCGDSAKTQSPHQASAQSDRAASAEIRRVVDEANSTFAKGDYKRSCSFYTPTMQREIARMLGAATCERAQMSAAHQLRQLVSAAQFRALTTYGIESVAVHGNSASARYGRLPRVLADVPGLKTRALLRMKRIHRRWLIASLPI
jgi:hypothetical protein